MDEGGAELVSLATQMYAAYHPGATQQRIYQAILEDERFKTKSAQEQLAVLGRERDQILTNLSRFRESGLGASGKAGRTQGGATATSTGQSFRSVDLTAAMGHQNKRLTSISQHGIDYQANADAAYKPPPVYEQFTGEVLANLAGQSSKKAGITYENIVVAVGETAREDWARRALANQKIPISNRQGASEDLYRNLYMEYPHVFQEGGQLSNAAWDVAKLIDSTIKSEDFIVKSFQAGKMPSEALTERWAIAREGPGIPAGSFERAIEGLVEDTDGDGKVSTEERLAAEATLAAQGIVSPLSVEEQAFLGRYIEALRDDGKATREELGLEYDQALAAYEKGRMVERLPRGAAAFYDESYLRGLARLGQVDTEMAELSDRPTPQTAAARRTLGFQDTPHRPKRGLPYVPPEALAAAASVSPLAAESLPWALKRVQDGDGNVEPRTRVEKFTQRLIETERLNPRDFSSIVRAVNKEYPNDPDRRLEAFAYYGAFNYMMDTRDQTLAQGPARADPQMAATEAQQFEREVAPRPMPKLPELTPPEEFAPGLYPPPAAPAAQPTPAANYIRQPDGSWKRVGE
tara:strand:- start:5745 stop:7475 length:1731 start_codon:yes stop_codon:yes gene_type:complete